MRIAAPLALTLFVTPAAAVASPDPPVPPTVRAARFAEPPVIDGRGTDAVWQQAEPAGDFVQQQADPGQPATERTEVRVGFDSRMIYIGVVCFDRDPARIMVSQSRRDGDLSN